MKRGTYVTTKEEVRARSGKQIRKNQLLFIMDREVGGWLPVLYRGRLEFIRPTARFKVLR